MNSGPTSWKALSPPSNPKAYLEVCDLLAQAGGIGADVLVDFGCRAWLQQCQPGKSRRIFLYTDCFVSVVDRLTKSVWLRYLRSNAGACAQICQVLVQLRRRINEVGEVKIHAIHSSLVGRRLIQIATFDVDVSSSADVEFFLDGCRLPPPWGAPNPSSRWLPHGTAAAVRRFCWEVGFYWSILPWHAQSEARHFGQDDPEASRRDRGLRTTLYELRPGSISVSGPVRQEALIDSTEVHEKLPNWKLKCVAAVSGYANQLAPSHREMLAAIELLKSAWNFDYHQSRDEHIRDLAFGAVCVLGGISPRDLLSFSLQNGEKSVAGRIEAGRLFIYVGSGIHPGLLGRVPCQTLEIPLPVRCVELLIEVQKRYPRSHVSGCYFKDPLGTILQRLAHFSRTDCELSGFLHRPFVYVALNFAKVSPGVCQLMLGRPIGPYRSALNYTSVSHSLIWREMIDVQRSLLNLAGLVETWPAANRYRPGERTDWCCDTSANRGSHIKPRDAPQNH